MNFLIKIIVSLFLLFSVQTAKGQNVELTPLYNTIGVKITNISNVDSSKVEYKQTKESNWRLAYQPDRISINNTEQFRGSIFGLDEGTLYDVKITVFLTSGASTLPSLQTTTLISPDFNHTANVKWVSPSGTGNYTINNPGNLTTLFSTGQVTCGTTIVFKDGIYKTNGLQLNLNNNCTAGTPILLIAEAGASPVFDASTTITRLWTPHATIANLYSTPTPLGTSHSNICVMGNTALYPYPSVVANGLLGNYNLSDLNFGYDGFVRDENTIWIKTNKGINPNDSVVKVSNSFRFLTVYGNNRNAFLKIKGIEFRYFGKPVLNSLGSASDAYSATVFDLRNVHHVCFDSCRFLFNTDQVYFTNQCNNITIQNTYIKHDAGKWTHAMIKKSHVFVHSILGTVSSSRARGVEGPAIFIHESKSVVIRNNIIDGTNSGIESYFDVGLKEDVDIYNNLFIDNFDAVECDGLWSNLRVWNNEMIRPMAGISASPPLIGPRYFYRNVFHGMKGRRNEQDDPHFIGCYPVSNSYMGQAIGIKTNSGYLGNISPGNLYFFNNTFHASDTLGFVFTSWESEWRKAVFINNAYSHSISHPFYFFSLADKTVNGDFQISSMNDNYFSDNANSPIAKVKHIHGQYTCSDIDEVSKLQSTLISISGSSNILIQNPIQKKPQYQSTGYKGFELSRMSPLIDAGSKIQGFYDFNGNNPDVGAKESVYVSDISKIFPNGNDILIYPNPLKDNLIVKLPVQCELVSIRICNSLGKKVHNIDKLSGQEFIVDIESLQEGIYFIEIQMNSVKIVKEIIKISF